MKKSTVTKIAASAIILAVGFFFFNAVTESVTRVGENPGTNTATKGLVETVPFIVIAVFIVSVISLWYIPKVVERFRWSMYGRRMKRAYAAKFGGENPEFDREVDYRIKVMRVQGSGRTWTLAEDWLRRMTHFVEIPWKDLSDEASRDDEEYSNEETHTDVRI